MFKRVLLFLLVNFAILFVLNIFLNVVLPMFGIQLQGNQYLMVFALVFGMGGAFVSLAISKWLAIRSTGAKIIKDPRSETEQWLVNTVRQQAQRANIGMPDVAIYPSDQVNAFATGMKKNNALVAVSTGLLNKMSRDEAEAVLGHEVSHVANGDMITLTLIQGVLNAIVIFLARIIGRFVDQALSRGESNGIGIGYFVTVIVAEIVLGILASIIVMWFSRMREFRADAGGAKLASKEKMIAALEKLRLLSGQEVSTELPSEFAAFGISGKKGIMRLFMSHPPLEERIKRLQGSMHG